MKTRLLFLALSFLALVAAPLRAAAPKYLTPGQPDATVLLAPPPAAGSAENAADLELAFRVYSARTADELARAKDEVKLTVFHFGPAIGPWFVPEKLPKTAALFKQVEADTKLVTNAAKQHWERLRPYHADPARFTAAIESEPRNDYSYPSGHSTRGTLYSLLLIELFPEKRDALFAKGRESGWLRVIGGVHYLSDVQAGRVLGQELARRFLASPAFQADLAAAQAEMAAAAKTP